MSVVGIPGATLSQRVGDVSIMSESSATVIVRRFPPLHYPQFVARWQQAYRAPQRDVHGTRLRQASGGCVAVRGGAEGEGELELTGADLVLRGACAPSPSLG